MRRLLVSVFMVLCSCIPIANSYALGTLYWGFDGADAVNSWLEYGPKNQVNLRFWKLAFDGTSTYAMAYGPQNDNRAYMLDTTTGLMSVIAGYRAIGSRDGPAAFSQIIEEAAGYPLSDIAVNRTTHEVFLPSGSSGYIKRLRLESGHWVAKNIVGQIGGSPVSTSFQSGLSVSLSNESSITVDQTTGYVYVGNGSSILQIVPNGSLGCSCSPSDCYCVKIFYTFTHGAGCGGVCYNSGSNPGYCDISFVYSMDSDINGNIYGVSRGANGNAASTAFTFKLTNSGVMTQLNCGNVPLDGPISQAGLRSATNCVVSWDGFYLYAGAGDEEYTRRLNLSSGIWQTLQTDGNFVTSSSYGVCSPGTCAGLFGTVIGSDPTGIVYVGSGVGGGDHNVRTLP